MSGCLLPKCTNRDKRHFWLAMCVFMMSIQVSALFFLPGIRGIN